MISITITSFNRFEYLQKSIDSLLLHTNMPFELIVVDNNSEQNVIEYLRAMYEQDKIQNLILNDSNVGLANGLNQGWKASSSQAKYLVAADNDVLYCKDWAETLTNALDKVPNLGAIGAANHAYQKDPENYQPNYKTINHVTLDKQKRQIAGSNVMIRKSDLEKFGYWIPHKAGRKIGGVDARYCKNIRRNGYFVAYHPNILIEHMDQYGHPCCLRDSKYKEYSKFIWKEKPQRPGKADRGHLGISKYYGEEEWLNDPRE